METETYRVYWPIFYGDYKQFGGSILIIPPDISVGAVFLHKKVIHANEVCTVWISTIVTYQLSYVNVIRWGRGYFTAKKWEVDDLKVESIMYAMESSYNSPFYVKIEGNITMWILSSTNIVHHRNSITRYLKYDIFVYPIAKHIVQTQKKVIWFVCQYWNMVDIRIPHSDVNKKKTSKGLMKCPSIKCKKIIFLWRKYITAVLKSDTVNQSFNLHGPSRD